MYEKRNKRIRQIKWFYILTIIFLINVVCLTGCGKKSKQINNTEDIPEPSNSLLNDNNQEIIDYNQYLKKIWIVKNWSGEGGYDYFSFYISKIENGIIEGKICVSAIAFPEFSFRDFEDLLGDLNGTVNNDKAECKFNDIYGTKGNIVLNFQDNELEAKIEYLNKERDCENKLIDGQYVFRPYNLNDIKDFIPDKKYSFITDLDSWGNVNLISGEVNHTDKFYPAIYLTNDCNDIFYKFQASFKTGTKVKEATVKDYNNDGRKDVKIITAFDDIEIEDIEWLFYQGDNGLFYNSRLNEN